MIHYISLTFILLGLSAVCSAYDPITNGGDCTKSPNKCASGLACVGPTHHRRCKVLRVSGQRCGQDPYWVCASGLMCEHNYCRISQGSQCTYNPTWCKKGLQCVGTKHYKRCEKPVQLGGSCLIEPWWVCKSGLVCHHNKCRIPQGGACTHDPKWCQKGLKCVGTRHYKRCEKPVPAGGSCLVEPWWVCAYGLTCEHNICRIPKGGECTYNPHACSKGLQCLGNAHYKQCEYPVKLGGACGIKSYWVCDQGLVCGGLGSARKCINGVRVGYPCRPGNPKMACTDGLRCLKGFCRY